MNKQLEKNCRMNSKHVVLQAIILYLYSLEMSCKCSKGGDYY